jgi:hypothetical protein
VTQSHYDESANSADTSDNVVAERDEAAVRDETTGAEGSGEATHADESHEATNADEPAAEPDEQAGPDEPTEPNDAAPSAAPRVRDAVRRLDDLSDLAPAEHVEVYEAVHSSLQESLAAASRQADESPPDGSSPS